LSETEPDEVRLPWIYRIILKLPKIEVSPELQGVYWAIVIPIFLVCEFFLSLFLLLVFQFPINLVMVSIIPVAIFVVFVKVQLERFVNWWNATFRSQLMKWDIEKTTEEYIKLLQKQKSKGCNSNESTYEESRKED